MDDDYEIEDEVDWALEEVLPELESFLQEIHGDRLWAAHPLGCWSLRWSTERFRKERELDRRTEQLGRVLLAGWYAGRVPDEAAMQAGAEFVRGRYGDLLRRQDEELALWHSRDWTGLRSRGLICDDTAFALLAECGVPPADVG